MKYVSTRGKSQPKNFDECLSLGLADDGGLFVPELFPSLNINEITKHSSSQLDSLAAFSARILAPFVKGSAIERAIGEITANAMDFPVPLKFLSKHPGTAVLELFHGPTAAFKDVGARFLAHCLIHLRARGTVLVATSGDTGGAVASAFADQPGMNVVILYPKGRISARQEKQLTVWGPSVRAFAVRGGFDDCQRLVKQGLADDALSQHQFISANSISIGRLLPQMCYHAKASLDYLGHFGETPSLIIPTGNLGNAVAALWAKRLGFPIAKVVLATNANRTLADFFATGSYSPGATVPTLANAMDVSAPSNFERLQHLYPDLQSLKMDVSVVSVTDAEISSTIASGPEADGEVWCPHTATAIFAKKKQHIEHALVSATAHPAKFETVVEPLIQHQLVVPPGLGKTLQGHSVSIEIEPIYADFVSALNASKT